MLVRIGIAAKLKGVSTSTLRRWEKEQKVETARRTLGGHRRYTLAHLVGKKEQGRQQPAKMVIGYARVSATKQKNELLRQQEQLRTFAHQQGWVLKNIFSDIASGMNEQRKGLHLLLKEVASSHPFAILCTYEDRLARFGTKVIRHYCQTFETEIVSIHQTEHNSDERKLVEDMIALVTSFAERLHRQRRGKKPPPSG